MRLGVAGTKLYKVHTITASVSLAKGPTTPCKINLTRDLARESLSMGKNLTRALARESLSVGTRRHGT
jgi:hypothetical protein